MSEIGDTFKALKELRRNYKRDNPRCSRCNKQLQLSQYAEEKELCLKCSASG